MSQKADARLVRTSAEAPFILVALDAGPASQAALEACVELAATLGVDVRGLFVEDAQWLQAAAIPYTQGIGSFTSSSRPLDLGDVERQMRALARSARCALAERADAAGVNWQFDVVRGHVAPELVVHARGAALVGIGTLGCSSLRRRDGVGATLKRVLAERDLSLVILRPEPCHGNTVLAVCETLEAIPETLKLATALAGGQGRDITLLLHGDAPAELDGRPELRQSWLEREGIALVGRPNRALDALCLDVERLAPDWILVATREAPEQDIMAFLARSAARVLILRDVQAGLLCRPQRDQSSP